MAKHDLFKPDSVDLSELLGNGRTYIVPVFQRDYSWKDEQWGDLWEDILRSRQTGIAHYMGAIVLQNLREHPVYVSGRVPAWVRDGMAFGPPRTVVSPCHPEAGHLIVA